MKFELKKKLSVKEVCGDVKKRVPDKEGTVNWIMEVMGIANGFKTGTSTFGDFIAFTGTFKAVDSDTGTEYRAGKVFLPGILQELLLPAVSGVEDKKGGVEFAFRIGLKKDPKIAVGYQYTAEPLLPIGENDPLELLGNKVKALPAPDKKPAKAETKAA